MNSICKECGGKCCLGFFIEMKLDADTRKYMKAHGVIPTENGYFVPLRCRFLKKGKCVVYHSERRPKLCDEWNCTYLGGDKPVPPVSAHKPRA